MNNQLDFCFKGDRNYVQGPDIFNKLMLYFASHSPKNIDIKFNGIVSKNLHLIEGSELNNAKVNLSITLQDRTKKFQLIESEQVINCRYLYDESLIINNTALNLANQVINLQQDTQYTFCENFIAMNKHLLQSLFPDEKGKWYFTRLELKHPVEDNTLLSVKFIKNFNFKLTKSDIYIENNCVGSVYFTMVRK